MPRMTFALLLIGVITAAGGTIWLGLTFGGSILPGAGMIAAGLSLSLLAWSLSRD